jgi:NADH-quinone oxidoreductase subunit M
MPTFLSLLSSLSLTLLVFFPTLACIPLLFVRRGANPGGVKLYALLVSLIELALGVAYVAGRWSQGFVDLATHREQLAWIPQLGIRYDLALDGISLPLVLLTVVLLPIVFLGSWRGIEKHWSGYAISMLLLTTGMLGTLLAMDMFLFYVFWELMLVPMYLIIGIWGGERRIYAAVKFFLYTMAGSLLMLLAILWMAWTVSRATGGPWSFSYFDWLGLTLDPRAQLWLFGAFALAFAIKVPMFPLHTWLPAAHVEAPTGGSVILAGVLLKLGTYGFLRFALPLFPQGALECQPLLVALSVIGILYGAVVAWVQPDMKKLVAYSSVAHLGFVMLGLLAYDLTAWQGALLQMVNHGLSTGALFLLVGMIYDRRHTKKFDEFGGLAKVMPWFAFFLVFSTLASVGLPGLNGFVGEFLILVGAYRAGLIWPTILAAFGVVLAAVYLLKMLAATIWGPITKDENRGLADLDLREKLLLLPLCVFMLWIGVAPKPFLDPSVESLRRLLERSQVTAAASAAEPAGAVVSSTADADISPVQSIDAKLLPADVMQSDLSADPSTQAPPPPATDAAANADQTPEPAP